MTPDLKLLFGENKCIVTCPAGKHVFEVHSKCDGSLCDRIAEQMFRGELECGECAWASTGIDHVRGYLK